MAEDIFYTEDDLEDMEEPEDDEDLDEEDYEDEPEIFGYECLGCNCTFGPEEVSEGDPCPVCGAIALSPLME